MNPARGTLWLTLAIVLHGGPGPRAEYSVSDLVDAARRGDTHAVHRLLVDNPGAVEARDEAGYTALHWAGIRGHWRIVRELVVAGAPVGAAGGDGGTPLHWAAHHDQAEIISLLLDAGADPGIRNRWGRTPLHVAARRGCAAVAGVLIARGARLEARTNEGWTPLHVASMSGHEDLVSLLVAAGADAGARDGEGRTPAQVARTRPQRVPMESETLDELVGLYELGPGLSVKVWKEGDGLRIREFAPDGLYPVGTDLFFCEREPWQVRFLRDPGGRIDSIELQFLRRTVRGKRRLSPRYVGSAACRECHEGPGEGSPYPSWLRSRHGHAYWRLGADWSLYLARLRPQYQDLERPIEDSRCLLCHTTGRQDDGALFADSYRDEEGVGCEACHGPGSLYMSPEIMGDREAFLAAGGIVPGEETCRNCHRNSERFDFAEMWPRVAHGLPPAGS